MLCDYGCGQEGIYKFKNGKWCCSKSQNSCPVVRRKNSESSKGTPSGMLGKKLSEETKYKISKKLKGRVVSDKTKKKMSEFQKGKVVSDETKHKISKGRKGKYKGIDNPNWKGGYFSKGIPCYDNFCDTLIENCRRNADDINILEVKCSFDGCKKWFIPSIGDVYHRIESLNSTKGMGESKLYCSDECKQKCSIFGLNYDPFEKKILSKTSTYNDYHIFRIHVLKRDNYKCQYCGEQAEHVHHERPQKLEPFFALDPDLAWSVCKKCHYKYGHKDECSTGNLARKKCK